MSKGQLITDVSYSTRRRLAAGPTASLPSRIEITRPQDQYKLSITYQDSASVELNREYPPKAFVLENKWRIAGSRSRRAEQEVTANKCAGISNQLSMRTILQAEDLVKVYRIGKVDVPALRGVSLEVQEGEFVAIMGPSGCGKSTMLHLLGGLLTPTSGRIVIDGEDITAASDAKRTAVRRKKIGFVFQRFNLFPTLTAEGNLRLAERIHGNGGGNAQLRRDVLRLLGLEDKLHHKPLELSGGEQQRVALARAVVTRPAIVLADEPTGNLDSENSALVLNMFQELNYRFNQTIIMITHNPEAAAMCKRIVQMRDGHIVEQSPTVGSR